MSRRIFVHANNVHQGGGRSLLQALLAAVAERQEWFATLDARLAPLHGRAAPGRIRWVPRSLLQRLRSERWLARQVGPDDLVLCFGNLPPLWRSRGQVVVFVQNRYLLEPIGLEGFALPVRWRIRLERLWLSRRAANVDLFVVQTPTMKDALQARLPAARAIAVLPFAEVQAPVAAGAAHRYDFLYVASGEPHKNHRTLVEAWCRLAVAGCFPSLGLTLDARAFPELCHWIEERKARWGLKIDNLGIVPADELRGLYAQVSALVYPSRLESFGLPLVEARQAGLPVLAPELDYVRDILDPVQTFDAGSPVSIARAVKRFFGIGEAHVALLHASEFLDAILSTPRAAPRT